MRKIKLKLNPDQAALLHIMCTAAHGSFPDHGIFLSLEKLVIAEALLYLSLNTVFFPRPTKIFSFTPAQALVMCNKLPELHLSGPNNVWANNERLLMLDSIRKQLP